MKRRDFLKTTLAAGMGAVVSGAPVFLRYALGETPIKYGIVIPLVGGLAELAGDQKLGNEIAIEEINASGGIMGRKVELIIRDSEMSAPTARRKAIELLDRDKIDILAGACCGWEEFTLNDLARKRGINYFVYPQYILDSKKHFHKNVFNLANVTPYQGGSANAKWVAKNIKGKRWHMLADNYSWPKMWLPAYKKWAKKTGKEWTGETWAPFPCMDYSTFIPQVMAKKPDVLFTVTWGSGQINQIKQFNEFALAKQMAVVFGVSDVPWAHAAGKGTFEGMYAGMPWYWKLEDKYPEAKSFNKKFFDRGKRMPAGYGQAAYATPLMVADVINEIKSLKPEKISRALEGRTFKRHTVKSEIYIRPCDHVSIQEFYFGKGKAKNKMSSDFDFFDIVGSTGGEDITKPCSEKGFS